MPRTEKPEPEVPGSPAPQAGEPVPNRSSISELDALEHDLDVSEARLDTELDKKRAAPPLEESPEAAPTEGAADSATSAASTSAQRQPPATRRARGHVGSPCDLGCRALSSMRRAQQRICEIAGSGPRCQRALDRVQTAAGRVQNAGCECRDAEAPP